MKKKLFVFSFLVFSFCIIILSCSTSKNRFFNRNYHRLTTKYNVLFNGEEAFGLGYDALLSTHRDDFFELLSIYPYTIEENSKGLPTSQLFSRAETKAIKAIQKHSMRIKDVEYNRLIERVYLLLIKSRFFDGRFILAINSTKEFLNKFPNSIYLNEVLLWRAILYIQLEYEELAIRSLKQNVYRYLKSDPLYGENFAVIGQAHMNLKQIDSALYYMKKAADYKEINPLLKPRYLFITAQMYERQNKLDSALLYYKKIHSLSRRKQQKFGINSILQSHLINAKQGDTINFTNKLLRLTKRERYKKDNYIIYKTLGEFALNIENNPEKAIDYFNKSLKETSNNIKSKSQNYQLLSEYYFKEKDFLSAGIYLDSTIRNTSPTNKNYRDLQKKYQSLETIVFLEKKLKDTDSILTLISKTKPEQKKYFENYIDTQNEKELKKLTDSKETQSESTFYFYNTLSKTKGQQQFQSIWGNRPNVDEWRLTSKINSISSFKNTTLNASETSFFKKTPESYMALLPKDSLEIDSIKKDRNQNLLKLGAMYATKYSNQTLATSYLEKLLASNPSEEEKEQGLFFLSKTTNPKKIVHYKTASILEDTTKVDSTKSPSLNYRSLKTLYDSKQYEKVIEATNNLKPNKTTNAKTALLRANSLGKINGLKVLEKEYRAIIKNYPSSIERRYVEKQLNYIEEIKIDSLGI